MTCLINADDISTVRLRTLNYLWPDSADMAATVQQAISFVPLLNSSCYFSDIDYSDRNMAKWPAVTHAERVTIMIQALTAPSSPIFQDANVTSAMKCALDVWLIRRFVNPNWWYQWIGVPLQLSQSLLMLGLNRTTPQEQAAIIDICYGAAWWVNDYGGGANLVWMISVELYRSLATSNVTGINESFAAMWPTVVIEPLTIQGIQVDYAYHFHGQQLQSGAYGDDWVSDILSFVSAAAGTQWALPLSQLNDFANFLAFGDAFLTHENVWEWHAIGRVIDRPGPATVGFSVDQLRSIAPYTNVSQQLTEWADRIEKKANAVQLVGNHHFFTSDVHVHRRKSWSAALKVHSVRTTATECDNGENLKGEHLSDGVLNLYTSSAGPGVYENIFPLFDWSMINGITVEYDTPLELCNSGGGSLYKTWPQKFVGGVSDGENGLVVMDAVTHNLSLHRTWSFSHDFVIAMNANITDPSRAEVRTTIASRRLLYPATDERSQVRVLPRGGQVQVLRDGVTYNLTDVEWILCGDVAYFPERTAIIGIQLGNVTGNFNTIGPYDVPISSRMATIWIDHGRRPRQLQSLYAIAAAVSVADMPVIAKTYASDVQCVTNSAVMQSAAYVSQQLAHIAVWPSSTSQNAVFECISLNLLVVNMSAAIYQIRSHLHTDTYTFTMSHPTLLKQTLSITLTNIALKGDGCTLQGSSTLVSFVLPSDPNYLGGPVVVTCIKVNARISLNAF